MTMHILILSLGKYVSIWVCENWIRIAYCKVYKDLVVSRVGGKLFLLYYL